MKTSYMIIPSKDGAQRIKNCQLPPKGLPAVLHVDQELPVALAVLQWQCNSLSRVASGTGSAAVYFKALKLVSQVFSQFFIVLLFLVRGLIFRVHRRGAGGQLRKFFAPEGGGLDCVYDGVPEAALFERVIGVSRCSGRRYDLVSHRRRVLTRRQKHLSSTCNCLSGERHGDLSGEPHFNASVSHGFHQRQGVRWTASGNARHRVQGTLGSLHTQTYAVQEAFRHLDVTVGDIRSSGES